MIYEGEAAEEWSLRPSGARTRPAAEKECSMNLRKLITVVAIGAGLALGGCASWQVPPESASYGHMPVGYEASIRAAMENYLKDPASATYRFGKPVRAYTNYGWAEANGRQVEWTGYLVKVDVNAKNGFGGYVGYKPYMILFTDNTVFRVLPGNEHPLVHVVQ